MVVLHHFTSFESIPYGKGGLTTLKDLVDTVPLNTCNPLPGSDIPPELQKFTWWLFFGQKWDPPPPGMQNFFAHQQVFII